MDGRAVYIETSVVVRRLLGEADPVTRWRTWRLAFTSELTFVEVHRTLDRMRVQGDLTEADRVDLVLELNRVTLGLTIIPVRSQVLRRAAGPFTTAIGTLDAIHLATMLIWSESHNEPVLAVTHDNRLATAARACGMEVYP